MTHRDGVVRERFVWPPFSVLDTRRQEWRARRARWTDAGVSDTTTRAQVLTVAPLDYGDFGVSAVAPEQSTFDPVLAELIVRWYSPPAGTVLDPFAGGPVRGCVAGSLGRSYIGIDLRGDQVAHDREAASRLALPDITYIEGDSRDAPWGDAAADLLFTCPPYFDLELYSDDPRDLSRASSWSAFAADYTAIIGAACKALRADRFAVLVVGEVRGPDGGLRSLVALSHEAMRSAGLRFASDAILVNSEGTAAMRASRQFASRRTLVRHHQYVLVYAKGRPDAGGWGSPATIEAPGWTPGLFEPVA